MNAFRPLHPPIAESSMLPAPAKNSQELLIKEKGKLETNFAPKKLIIAVPKQTNGDNNYFVMLSVILKTSSYTHV